MSLRWVPSRWSHARQRCGLWPLFWSSFFLLGKHARYSNAAQRGPLSFGRLCLCDAPASRVHASMCWCWCVQLRATFEFDETAQPGWTPGRDMHHLVHILHVRQVIEKCVVRPYVASISVLRVPPPDMHARGGSSARAGACTECRLATSESPGPVQGNAFLSK